MEEEYSGAKVWSKQNYDKNVNKYKCKYSFVLMAV
jgi:hypothetical protein